MTIARPEIQGQFPLTYHGVPTVSSAVFSEDRVYRYMLTRIISSGPWRLLAIMVNPSTADELTDDPTIRRWLGFARIWGFGVLRVVNLNAFRATEPIDLFKAHDPVGPDNDKWLKCGAEWADTIVVSWGVHGAWRGRDTEVSFLLEPYQGKLYSLGLTKQGHPRHPLRLRRDTKLQRWQP